MTLDQFIAKYKGKFVEYHSYNPNAKNQCVDLANQYIVEVLGLPAIIGTNAQDFPSKKGNNFTWIPNTPDGLPNKGDLMIFKSSDGVGHISIFIEGNLSLFKSFDQNYPTGSACSVVQHNYRNVLGWLRPLLSNQETMPDELQTILNKYAVKTAQELMSMFDKELSFLKDEREKNKALKEVNKKQLEDHTRFIERVAELIGSPKDETSIIEFCSRFNSSLDEALEYKDKWEREVQAHKETVLKHSDELGKFDELIHTIEDEFEVKIEQLQDEHERAIKHLQDQLSQAQANAQIANEALHTATKFAALWKWVVSLGKGS